MAHSTTVADIVDMARRLMQAGRLGPARRAYKEALRAAPHSSELLQEAGVLEVEAGRMRDALVFMKKAVELSPHDPDAHMNLAEVYRLAEDLGNARKHFAKASELAPEDPYAAYALADVCVMAGEWTEAGEYLERARRQAPSDPEIWNLSGIVYEEGGRAVDAKSAFEKAVSLNESYVEARSNLASICLDMNHYRDAIHHYTTIAQSQPLNGDQLNNLYVSYSRLDMPDLALETATKLTSILPTTAASLVSRGSAHRALGSFDEAERDYRAALEVDPSHAPAYENLGIIHRLSSNDLSDIEEKRQQPDMDDTQISELSFALYHGYKDHKAYDEAFAALLKANDIVAQQKPVDPGSMVESVNNTIHTFSSSFFEKSRNIGYAEEGPIFIVGMPRSGTTLTERILAAHPRIRGGGERHDLPHVVNETEGYPKALKAVSSDWATQQGKKVHESMFLSAPEANFVTDKMPGNYINIGLINLILPKAKIIYCKRNPIDNCLSCFEQHFATKQNYTYQLDMLAEAYKQHERLMQHWKDVSTIPIHTLNYEDVVREPEPHIRGMIDYIGLEWDDACLAPEKVDQSIATASVWQARQPINRNSIDRWKRFEQHLKPLIDALDAG